MLATYIKYNIYYTWLMKRLIVPTEALDGVVVTQISHNWVTVKMNLSTEYLLMFSAEHCSKSELESLRTYLYRTWLDTQTTEEMDILAAHQ